MNQAVDNKQVVLQDCQKSREPRKAKESQARNPSFLHFPCSQSYGTTNRGYPSIVAAEVHAPVNSVHLRSSQFTCHLSTAIPHRLTHFHAHLANSLPIPKSVESNSKPWLTASFATTKQSSSVLQTKQGCVIRVMPRSTPRIVSSPVIFARFCARLAQSRR